MYGVPMNDTPQPYLTPKAKAEASDLVARGVRPRKSLWKRRGFALAAVVFAITLLALAFTVGTSIPLREKPQFFLRVWLGPFGAILEGGRFRWSVVESLVISSMVFLYPAFPNRLTAVVGFLGVVCWWGCGVAIATGGV